MRFNLGQIQDLYDRFLTAESIAESIQSICCSDSAKVAKEIMGTNHFDTLGLTDDTGRVIGYIDILVPTNCDFALNDSAISDFPSVIPPSLKHYLNGLCTLDTQRAKSIREGWSGRDSLWVRQDFRRAGIGSTLERVAGDVCKLVYPTVKKIGIIFNVDNTKAYLMHIKAGAKKVDDHHYRLEYTLDNKKRPQINILYGI